MLPQHHLHQTAMGPNQCLLLVSMMYMQAMARIDNGQDITEDLEWLKIFLIKCKRRKPVKKKCPLSHTYLMEALRFLDEEGEDAVQFLSSSVIKCTGHQFGLGDVRRHIQDTHGDEVIEVINGIMFTK